MRRLIAMEKRLIGIQKNYECPNGCAGQITAFDFEHETYIVCLECGRKETLKGRIISEGRRAA